MILLIRCVHSKIIFSHHYHLKIFTVGGILLFIKRILHDNSILFTHFLIVCLKESIDIELTI